MTDDNQTTLGRNVATYRRAKKISGEDLAELAGAGLTRSIIANLENGRKKDLTVSQLIAVAFVLGVTPASLVFDLLDPYEGTPLIDTETNQISAQNWLAYRWFGGEISPDKLVVTSENEQHSANALETSNWMINYLLGRRSVLLLGLEDLQKTIAYMEKADGENVYRTNEPLASNTYYQADKDKARQFMAELYDIDGQLRKMKVQIDKPIIHPFSPS